MNLFNKYFFALSALTSLSVFCSEPPVQKTPGQNIVKNNIASQNNSPEARCILYYEYPGSSGKVYSSQEEFELAEFQSYAAAAATRFLKQSCELQISFSLII